MTSFIEELKRSAPCIEIKKDLPMCDYTTFRIGGRADVAIFPKNKDELVASLDIAKALSVRCYVVGKGSNLLVSDEGFRGAVIFTSGLSAVTYDRNELYAEAGVNLTSLSRSVAERGLTGLEFACGIPGTVGGAIYMNAGAYGSEMKNVTLYSDYYSLSEGFGRLVGDAQGFGYRESAYMGSDKIILGCRIALAEGDKNEIVGCCQELLARRREKQPLEYPSAGSAFKRYTGRFTGQMIEEAGLKGFRVGGAEVSEKHAGFVINKGGATASDVIELVRRVTDRVFEKEGVRIEPEIRYLSSEGEKKL